MTELNKTSLEPTANCSGLAGQVHVTVAKRVNEADNGWTIKKIMEWSTNFLKANGIGGSARLDVELLLTEVLGLSRIQLYTNYDREMTDHDRSVFKELLLRRKEFEPVAYILGRKEFYKYSFKVCSDVLIPRADTERLVETVVSEYANRLDDPLRVLDLGVGSGCIAVSIAKDIPKSQVVGVDICEKSLEIARLNAKSLGAENVMFEHGDMLDPCFWGGRSQFDLIVSNPPYIAESERSDLSASVLKFEPEGALMAEDDGLRFYKTMAAHCVDSLSEGGKIIVEVGYRQAERVVDIFDAVGLDVSNIIKDFSGHGRVVVATKRLPANV